MNKTALQLCLLTLLACLTIADNITSSKAGTSSEPVLCDKNLYKSLSKLKGRIRGPGVQIDLLKTLNQTLASDPKKVLQRISQYDLEAVEDYLELLDQSYAYEKAYVKYSNEGKASLDYENVCSDFCPTYTTFNPYNGYRATKNLAAPKPSNLDNFTCSVPDNPFCSDGIQYADQKDDQLIEEAIQQWIQKKLFGYGQTTLVYKLQEGELKYCYTINARKEIVNVCEKYQQKRLAISGYVNSPAFREQAYETVLTGDLSSQTAINYILTKMKFGERIGAIYDDCRRYGKLPTDIKKPI